MGYLSGKYDCWKGQGQGKKTAAQICDYEKINIHIKSIQPDSGSMGEKSMRYMYSLW